MSAVEELDENQSAAPRCCGSCHFFDRVSKTDWVGKCRVSLPPHFYNLLPGALTEQGPNTSLADNRGCDLWKPKTFEGKPVTFVQQRKWKAGESSR